MNKAAPNKKNCFPTWPRAIALVDMNAFFASIEQRDCPEWRGRPVAITNGKQGTCIITCSYEARAYGIQTGMRLKQARQLCPELIQCPAQPRALCRTVSVRHHGGAAGHHPGYRDILGGRGLPRRHAHCQRLLGTPPRIARLAKQKVFEASGILCSIGVSGDKTTAKFAAKLNKPDGLTVIPPWRGGGTAARGAGDRVCAASPGASAVFWRNTGYIPAAMMKKAAHQRAGAPLSATRDGASGTCARDRTLPPCSRTCRHPGPSATARSYHRTPVLHEVLADLPAAHERRRSAPGCGATSCRHAPLQHRPACTLDGWLGDQLHAAPCRPTMAGRSWPCVAGHVSNTYGRARVCTRCRSPHWIPCNTRQPAGSVLPPRTMHQ